MHNDLHLPCVDNKLFSYLRIEWLSDSWDMVQLVQDLLLSAIAFFLLLVSSFFQRKKRTRNYTERGERGGVSEREDTVRKERFSGGY